MTGYVTVIEGANLVKPLYIVVVTLLLVSAVVAHISIRPVRAIDTIYIRGDGSIDPPTAPIQRNGEVYTFTGNITGNAMRGIIVERDKILVDGAGYTLQGAQAYNSVGTYLAGRSNVTIKDMKITAFTYGIILYSSSDNSISGNSIIDGISFGICLDSACNDNSISGNNIISSSEYGIYLGLSHNNTVSGNNITVNGECGIYFDSGSGNSISGNNITVNAYPDYVGYGLYLSGYCNGSSLSGNNITVDGYCGIYLGISYNNSVGGNNITHVRSAISDWRESYGIYLGGWCSGFSLSENSITAFRIGIYLGSSSGNLLSGNTIAASSDYGIYLVYASNNTIYHNSFADNTGQVYSSNSTNVWDDGYPSGGNRWSDYTGADLYSGPCQNETGSDGIGDTPYVINADNRDNYPFAPHDIAVRELKSSRTVVGQGYALLLNVTVANTGDFLEEFNLTLYANGTAIATQTVTLASGNATTTTFLWNTTGFAKGDYNMSAYAWPVPDEIHAADNNLGGWVAVAMVGDLTGSTSGIPDGTCDIRDVAMIAKAFGSVPGDSRWNANCDVNNDVRVDTRDIAIVAKHFGQSDP